MRTNEGFFVFLINWEAWGRNTNSVTHYDESWGCLFVHEHRPAHSLKKNHEWATQSLLDEFGSQILKQKKSTGQFSDISFFARISRTIFELWESLYWEAIQYFYNFQSCLFWGFLCSHFLSSSPCIDDLFCSCNLWAWFSLFFCI